VNTPPATAAAADCLPIGDRYTIPASTPAPTAAAASAASAAGAGESGQHARRDNAAHGQARGGGLQAPHRRRVAHVQLHAPLQRQLQLLGVAAHKLTHLKGKL
jgi:hypothetical protein